MYCQKVVVGYQVAWKAVENGTAVVMPLRLNPMQLYCVPYAWAITGPAFST